MTHNPPLSPSHCSSDSSDNNDNSTATIATNDDVSVNIKVESPAPENDLALGEEFWSEVLSADNSAETTPDVAAVGGVEDQFEFLFSPLDTAQVDHEVGDVSGWSMSDGMDFWYHVYSRAEDFTHLPQL